MIAVVTWGGVAGASWDFGIGIGCPRESTKKNGLQKLAWENEKEDTGSHRLSLLKHGLGDLMVSLGEKNDFRQKREVDSRSKKRRGKLLLTMHKTLRDIKRLGGKRDIRPHVAGK